MSQSLILNIIQFQPPILEKEFAFYTKKVEGFCPIHIEDLQGLIEGLVDTQELDFEQWLYTDFQEPREDAIVILVNLQENIHFAAHYYRYLIREHFKGIADAMRPSFTNEIEVWFKHYSQPDPRFTIYNLYTLKIQHHRISEGAEMIVSYDGTTKVLNMSLSELGSIDTSQLNWIKADKELYKYKYLPVDYKQHLDKLHIVLTNTLKPAFDIAFDIPSTDNRYPKYWELLNDFYKKYLNTGAFKKVIPLCSNGFHAVPEEKIQMTLPGSNDLLFGLNRLGREPKTDMKRLGPYKPTAANNIRFIFIYQQSDRTGAVARLYNYFKDGMKAKDQQGNEYTAFPPIHDFIKQPLLFDDGAGISFQNINTAVQEVQKGVKNLQKKPGIQYIAIYVTPVSRFVDDEEQKKVYYRIKEILLQEGITSQVVYKDNISKDAFKYYLPNIEIAILAKLGGIPWRLNRTKSDELIVGIGAFYSITRKTRYVGSAFCFNNEGVFEGFDCFTADDPMMLAGSIRVAVSKYVVDHYTTKRLIIHFYKDISKKEIQPIVDTLHTLGLSIPVFVVTINKTESKELLAFDTKNQNLMPYSGTILKVGKKEYLLFNNTRYTPTSQVTAKEYHFPVKVSFAATQPELLEDENLITELMDQVYQFSRMYWKSVSQQNLPVTIKYPEMVAQIYPHFESNTLPEFARKNLWFL